MTSQLFDQVDVLDEIGLWTRVNKQEHVSLRKINWFLPWPSSSKSARIWIADRITKAYDSLAGNDNYDLIILNHPFIEPRSTPKNTVIDIIDNFSLHIRMADVDKERFRDRVRTGIALDYPFTVVTEAAAYDLGLKTWYCLDNHSTTLWYGHSTPVNRLLSVGFFSKRTDWDFIRELCQQGITIDLYGRFFDGCEREIRGVENLFYKGELHEKDKRSIIPNYKAMLISYREQTEHQGSPAKAYDALAYKVPVISTIDYPIDSPNFFHVISANDGLELLEKLEWDDSDEVQTFSAVFDQIIKKHFGSI